MTTKQQTQKMIEVMKKPVKVIKKKRKKKSKMYFGTPAQEAIMEYLDCPKTDAGYKERNKIYNERIKYPFEKLVKATGVNPVPVPTAAFKDGSVSIVQSRGGIEVLYKVYRDII